MVAIFFVGSGAVAGSVAVAVAGSGAIVGAVAVATAGGVAGTGAVAVAGASALAVALAVAGAVPVAVAVAGAGAGVSQWARDRAKKAQFYIVFSFLTIAVCALGAWMLPTFPGWRDAGPLLFFCGLLCMVNAPFNWASLGLTRFLLRRGLDKGGVWWPYAYALIDAVAGSMLITVLAVALTVAIDGFDTLAVQRGGEAARVLPPMRAYLADLRAHPGAYEYWWLHATILATLLPSVINLWIAGFVFLRGNILNQKILTLMPAGQAVPAPYSFVVAFVLTIQGALAVCFAFTAQAALVLLILQELMPLFRAGPLQAAKAFAF